MVAPPVKSLSALNDPFALVDPQSICVVPPLLTGVHVLPSPVNPGLHAHDAVPASVSVQVALAEQPPLFVEHGLVATGVHVMPLPVNPGLHAHDAVPLLSVHVALGEQPPLLVVHGLVVVPLPKISRPERSPLLVTVVTVTT